MRRLTAWLTGLAGGAAAYRLFRRAPRPRPEGGPAEAPDARAAELKERLAAARDREPFEAGETPVDAAPDPPTDRDLAERRRAVHDRARAVIDDMHGDEPTP